MINLDLEKIAVDVGLDDEDCACTLTDSSYCLHNMTSAVRAGARAALTPELGCEECNPSPHTILICPTHRAERLRALEEDAG
jgi:hypothetical protein